MCSTSSVNLGYKRIIETSSKYWLDWSLRRSNEAFYGNEYPDFDMARRDRQSRLIHRLLGGGLFFFALGVFVGFVALLVIQDAVSHPLS